MSTLVIKSIPEALHAKLLQRAATHGRTLEQEVIHLIEVALRMEDKTHPAAVASQFKADAPSSIVQSPLTDAILDRMESRLHQSPSRPPCSKA